MPLFSPPLIGGPIVFGTPGSVLFVGAGGLFAQDNSHFFWDDSTDTLQISGSANTLNLKGAASGSAPTISATGSDTHIPIRLAPKGATGFTQLGPNTYGVSGWSGFHVSAEIYRTTPTLGNTIELYIETTAGDVAGSYTNAINGIAQTSSTGTQNADSLYAFNFSVVNKLGAGKTLTSMYGTFASAKNQNAGTTTNCYGSWQQIFGTGGTIVNAWGTYSAIEASNGAITNAYAFYSPEIRVTAGGSITNAYAFWHDSPGVFRIKNDGVMGYYNPAFSPKYTAGATNYERVVQQWNSNVLEYGLEAGGTGTLRALRFIGERVEIPATPPASATKSLLGLGSAISGGSSSGTCLGINAPNAYAGNLLDFQINGSRVLLFSAAGQLDLPLLNVANGGGMYSTSKVTVRGADNSNNPCFTIMNGSGVAKLIIGNDGSLSPPPFGIGGAVYSTSQLSLIGVDNAADPLFSGQNLSQELVFLLHNNGFLVHTLRDTGSATVASLVNFGHNTSNTPSAGFGSEMRFQLESSTTEDQNAAGISWVWSTATHASRLGDLVFTVYEQATAREPLRFQAISGGSQILIADAVNVALNTGTGTKWGTSASQKQGWYNAAPVTQGSAWSITNGTTDRAYDANATTLDEIADALYTLVSDLQAKGLAA